MCIRDSACDNELNNRAEIPATPTIPLPCIVSSEILSIDEIPLIRNSGSDDCVDINAVSYTHLTLPTSDLV